MKKVILQKDIIFDKYAGDGILASIELINKAFGNKL
jgi:hypothetical protein